MNPENELGPQLAIYRARPFGGWDLLTIIFTGSLLVLAPLAYGIYRAYYAYTHHGPTLAAQWGPPWFLLALILLVVFALILAVRIHRLRRSVAVYAGGLSLALPRRISLCWEEISGISIDIGQERFLGIKLRKFYRATLYPRNGKAIPLSSSLVGLPELVTQIKAHLYHHLLPTLEADFKSGQLLNFGPVSIQASSLQVRKRQIPWAQVKGVDVCSGYLVIESEGHRRLRLPASTVPNLELLIQIIQTGVTV